MVIKVLKPGIEDTLVADLNFIYAVARVLEFLSPELERTSLVRDRSTCGDILDFHSIKMSLNMDSLSVLK